MKNIEKNNRAKVMWDIVEMFYRCRADFQEQYRTYEKLVAKFVEKYGGERHELQLDAAEVATLVDQNRMGGLRDNELFQLKELSHILFRGPDGKDDFDRFVSGAYHEISVLREEHYSVEHYIPAYEKGKEKEIAANFLTEAYSLFPRKMGTINDLFEKAKKRLEKLLPKWKRDTVFVRSLYLFGNDFLGKTYDRGIESLYEIMYRRGAVPPPVILRLQKVSTVQDSMPAPGTALRKAKAKLKNGEIKISVKESLSRQIEKLAKGIETAQSGRLRSR